MKQFLLQIGSEIPEIVFFRNTRRDELLAVVAESTSLARFSGGGARTI